MSFEIYFPPIFRIIFQSIYLKGFSLFFFFFFIFLLFLIFFLILLLSLIDLSLLVKVLYRLLSGLDLLGIGLTTGEEAAQREGGGAGHGDQQEGQEVSQHLHGVAGVVAVAIVSSGSDQAQLILFTDDHEMQRDIFILRNQTSVFLVHVNISTLELCNC